MSEMETTRNGMSGLQMLAAFLGGALAGTVATMLLAPRSGTETRRRIADAANRSKEKMERLGTAAREATTAARTAFTEALNEEGTRAHH